MHVPHGHSVHHKQMDYHQMERVGGSQPAGSIEHARPSGHASGFSIEDKVELSPMAQDFVENQGHCYGSGKSMHAAAHRARAMIEANPQLADMPFGQVVSNLLHGTLNLTPAVPTEGDGPDGAAPAETADAAAAEAGDVAELPPAEGDPAPAPGSGGAESASPPVSEEGTVAGDGGGSPVLTTVENGTETDGNDGAAETTTGVAADAEGSGELPSIEPTVNVDTTSILLDMLNGNADGNQTDQAAGPEVDADTTSTLVDMLDGDQGGTETDQAA